MSEEAKVTSIRIVRFTEREKLNPPNQVVTITLNTPPPIGLYTKAKHLRAELTNWIKNGAKLVPSAVRKERQATCEEDDGSGKPCPMWNPEGNWGLGECRHGSCGCTKAKAALATSKCPMGKWKR
jgi:hypothetical protein